MSPAMFHDLVAPYLAERIKHLRQFTAAHYFQHSCGSIYSLIPDLIRCGVEILNPIQPRTRDMEPQRLKADFGDRLTFYGGVDTQELLRLGTPAEVYEATRDLIGILSRKGGYILSAAHYLQDDVPDQNILAMFSAGRGTSTS
jgi:uroporphyrinogen decarboxylase